MIWLNLMEAPKNNKTPKRMLLEALLRREKNNWRLSGGVCIGNLFQPSYVGDSNPLPAAANQTLFLKLADDAAGCFSRRTCHLSQVIPGKGHLNENTFASNFSNLIGQLKKKGSNSAIY